VTHWYLHVVNGIPSNMVEVISLHQCRVHDVFHFIVNLSHTSSTASIWSSTVLLNGWSSVVTTENCLTDTCLMASFPRQPWYASTNKVKPIWILLEQEMMGWQWHQLDHMQIICTLLQTDNHASTSSLNFLQAGCSSWCQTNSVKALKESKNGC